MGIPTMFRIYHVETVPFTERSHLVIRASRALRNATELQFIRFKRDHASVILPQNHEITIRVNRILSKIVGAICRTKEPLGWAVGLDWEAVVLRDHDVQAKCWDDAGKIVVNTGLLNRFGTDEEIATVLAHEVGHVIARHSPEIIERFANLKWFPGFLLMPFFRRCELEADYIGMILLAASGFDPHVAPRTLKKVGDILRNHMPKNILYFVGFSTHPSPNERAKFLLQPKVVEEAMELYTQVTSVGKGSDKYLGLQSLLLQLLYME